MRLAAWFQLMVLCAGSVAQTVELPSNCGDCPNAIDIGSATEYGPTTAPRGGGNLIEVSDSNDQSLQFFFIEHHTVWYKWTVTKNMMLEFDVTPVNPNDDIDFLLFRYFGKDFCKKMQGNAILPVRTNISRVNPENKGMTGLSLAADQEFVHGGPGETYSKALKVKKGETFYLVLDHFREHETGHTLRFRAAQPTESHSDYDIGGKPGTLRITVRDTETGQSLKADLSIKGVKRNEPLQLNDIDSYTMVLQPYKSYTVQATKKGYLYFSKRIVASGDPGLVNLDVQLKPIKEGSKITLRDIYFKGDEAEILSTSEAALNMLVAFMQQNPDVKIEIQGHVNARKNNKKARNLSEDRAKEVFYYLVLKDVPRDRMKPKGYGNTQMIHPDPESENESAANRRVEIKVLSK